MSEQPEVRQDQTVQQQHAPSGRTGDAEKTVAPAGPGGTSAEDVDTADRAAREAGEYAAAVAGVDAEDAAPIPADDERALRDPDRASSAPAEPTA